MFIRAALDHLTQQGALGQEADGWVLRVPIADIEIGVPERVRQMIEAQIARLRPEEQRMLEVASVAGAVFTASVCAAAANLDPEHFEALCETLARRQHLVRTAGPQQLPDGSIAQRYAFVHALYREVCYWRQAPRRRATLHRRLGEQMEVVFAARLPDVASELAYHFEAGTAWARAVMYLRLVADTAERRYAYREAAGILRHALALVDHLPEAPERTRHALPLYIVLGAVLQTAQGHAAPEVEQAYKEAYTLCQQVGEPPNLVPVLMGLWRVYLIRPQMDTARKLGETLLRLAQQAHDPVLAVTAHYALGVTWFFLGVLSAARLHLEEGIARYTPEQRRAPVFRMGHDPGVGYRIYTAMTLWLLGYPAQALARLHDGLVLAHALSHPYSLAAARCWAAFVSQFRRDVPGRVRAGRGRRRALDGAWASTLGGLGNELAWVGAGHAGPGRGRHRTAPPGDRRLAGHRGSAVRPLLLPDARGSLCPPGPPGRWPPDAGRGPHPGRAAGGTPVGSGNLSPPGRRAPAANNAAEGEAEAWLQRALDVARRQEAKALELRAAIKLSAPVAAAREAGGGVRTARADLWLVHGGV